MAESLLRDAGHWEIVTFRYKPADSDEELANSVTDALSGAMAANGFAFASTTKLLGKTVMRLVTNNPRTIHHLIFGRLYCSWVGWRRIWRYSTKPYPQLNNMQGVAPSV